MRFDQPSGSWLGGLPMMPENVEWPTASTTEYPERGRTPLHFVAQVACADLPPGLWGGLGPRQGWLLLFLNGEDWDVMENREALQVIHIAELGPERQPPPGIFPVHDEGYTGPDFGFVRSQAEVPTTWRRWPVDVVTAPNHVLQSDHGATIIPDRFASTLYEGATVADGDGPIVVPEGPPFSWRGALYVTDSIARVLSAAVVPELRPTDVEKLDSPAWITKTLAAIDDRLAKDRIALEQWATRDFDAADVKAVAQREWAERSLVERITNLSLARDYVTQGDLRRRMETSHHAYLQWRIESAARVAEIRDHVLSHELDTPLAEGEWEAIRYRLEEHSCVHWMMGYRDVGDAVPTRVETSLITLAEKGLRAASVQIAADYYVASPEKRSMVPPALVQAIEPYWRRLYSNRPHRMGGVHDPIQSDPRIGPTREVLLFQIASDDAMHWTWGDGGAYYVFIDTDRLARNDFTYVKAFFENH